MENDINITNTDNEMLADSNAPMAEMTLQFATMEIEHVLNQHAKPYIKRLKRLALIVALIFSACSVLAFNTSYELGTFCILAVFVVFFYFFIAR